jgi:hypothetical protein
MNLPPFYIGQKVICITSGIWHHEQTGEPCNGPKRNDMCTVRGYEDIKTYGYEFPLLVGYDDEGFDYRGFKPLQELKIPFMEYSKIVEKELVSAN